jgi:hypothetical protein
MSVFQQKKALLCSLLIVFTCALSGCQSISAFFSANPIHPTATALPLYITATPENFGSETITSPPEITATVELTATPEFTSTPAFTSTPEPTSTLEPTPTPKEAPFFDQFVASIVNGNSGQVVGVYVEGLMALRVVQQPANSPAYVSTQKDVVTYFTMVTQITGNTGLLAHNYLAGVYYYELQPGQSVSLIYGDGHTDEFVVSESDQYQATNPESPTSNFIDLSSGESLSSTDLFYRVYGGSDRTTFQTCIAQGNEGSWGRLFVIAPQE